MLEERINNYLVKNYILEEHEVEKILELSSIGSKEMHKFLKALVRSLNNMNIELDKRKQKQLVQNLAKELKDEYILLTKQA
jgi:hypothetical protein